MNDGAGMTGILRRGRKYINQGFFQPTWTPIACATKDEGRRMKDDLLKTR
jgi:hypothetical protein